MEYMESFARIYEIYHGNMLTYAKKYVSESNAEDVVHDVFVKLMCNDKWLKTLISKPLEEQRRILFSFFLKSARIFAIN